MAKVRVSSGATTEELRLETRDISIWGVALKTSHPLPVGTEVELEVDLSYGDSVRFKDSIMKGSGPVVRIEVDMMAVAFRKPAQIILAKWNGPVHF
jgi:hypothetical protein